MKYPSLLSRRTLIAIITCALAGGFLITKSLGTREAPHWRYTANPGPWGNLECVRIAVEMPETFISLDDIKDLHSHWFFPQQTRDQVEAFLKTSGLTAEEFETIRTVSKWEMDSQGSWVSPPDKTVLGMNQSARQNIYSLLCRFPQNEPQHSPFMYRPELLPEMFARSGLKPETIERFHATTYRQGELIAFADTDVFVNHLPDEHEKTRFLKTISRASTMLVKLKIDETSNIDDLADYWSYGSRRKDIHALLESMAAVPGGSKIDIAHLLPGFVRQRVYTYPPPEDASLTNRHCHWTSFNFLNRVPDDRFGDEEFSRKIVETEFTPISDKPRLGDVIFFLNGTGNVIHSATYIADDIVFTKNGGAPNRPWIYMELSDLKACYTRPGEILNTVIWRRKDGAEIKQPQTTDYSSLSVPAGASPSVK